MTQEDKLAMLHALGSKSPPPKAPAPKAPLPWGAFLLAVVVVFVGAVAWHFMSGDSPKKTETPPQSVAASATDTPPATTPVSTSGLTASGYVVARRIATVAAEITGTVTEVLIEEGMEVKAGDVVARLDATVATTERDLAKAQLAQAQANVKSLQAQLSEANRVAARNRKLVKTGAVSEARLTDSASRSEALFAQLTQAKSAVHAAELEVQRRDDLLAKHVLRAPFDGMITDKNAQPGEIISPMSAGGGFTRTGICTIVDMASLEVEVDVNEANIARISPKQEAVAILDAYPAWKIPAEVIAIIPTANRDKATIKVRVGFKERDARILPEMAARVVFK